MKRLLISLTACLLAFAAHAQDKYIFDHLSLGLSAGTEGLSVEAATPLTQTLVFRAGYGNSTLFKFIKYTHAFNVNSNDPWVIKGTVPATFRPTLDNVHLLVDIFPVVKSNVRFTVGAYFMTGGTGVVHGMTDGPLPIPQEQYVKTGVKFTQNGTTEYVTTDADGYLQADFRVRLGRVLPYAGMGFNRAVADGRVRFLFDIGVLYVGGYDAVGYDYGINGTLANPKQVKLTTAMVKKNDGGVVDVVSKIPVYPVLKFSLFYNIF